MPLALRFLSLGGVAARTGVRVRPDAPGSGAPRLVVHTPAVPTVTSPAAKQLFLDSLPLIDGVVRDVCRTHRMSDTDREEFGAEVRLKLLENDYQVLREFEQRCHLRTYLKVVVLRLYFDYRNRQWGRWRPSVAAQRMGPIAILLETFIVRDRVPFDEACERVIHTERAPVTRRDLEEIAMRLPRRTRRVQVGHEVLLTVPAADDAADGVPLRDRARAARKLAGVLRAAVAALTPRERLLLRMRFQDGLAIADIAHALHCDARPLYRQMTRVIRQLRDALEAGGFDAADADRIISRQELDISLALMTEAPIAAEDEGPAMAGR